MPPPDELPEEALLPEDELPDEESEPVEEEDDDSDVPDLLGLDAVSVLAEPLERESVR
ncbi:hypothetical protein [Micromonospora craniellae]|uniref:hypothetical protein n=1 Tax=Micromonospora craniellae TaxID=2294034 RepID=UPI001F158D09|nr:hypothetical protein [Micromonospora craniellae]